MWLRQMMYRWLLPAAIVLPLWLLVGWGIFADSAWAFLWLFFIAIPSVLIAQLILAMLVRARPSVAAARAVSWPDVAGFGAWHLLTILVGFFVDGWFGIALAAAIVAAIVVFWSSLRQLRQELSEGPSPFMHVRQQVWSVRRDTEPEPGMRRPETGRPVDPSQITIVTDAPQSTGSTDTDTRG